MACEDSIGRAGAQAAVLGEILREEVAKGAIRYVLEGTGTVNLPDGESVPVGVGSLVKVTAEDGVALRWVPDDGEMLLLTPEYQGPPLLVTAGGFILACAALIAATATGL